MKKYFFLIIVSFLVKETFSQNTISIRKTDTSFNSIFYSKKVFENKSFTTLKGKEKQNKKARMYYVFGRDGEVWFFTESPKTKNVLKTLELVKWKSVTPTGKYFIKNDELVIYPYHRSISGALVLNEVFIDGVYNVHEIFLTQNGVRKKLVFLMDY